MPAPSMLRVLGLCALAAGAAAQPATTTTTTCADKAAAGSTKPCVEPFTFGVNATVNGFPLPAAWRAPAPVCFAQYLNNQLATPTFMPSNSICSAYANNGCCSSETVMSIDNDSYGKVGVYAGFSSRCKPLSRACEAYFQQEACFYECDANVGKFRKFRDTNCVDNSTSPPSLNMWQIQNLPLTSTLVDGWWNACKNDYFCTGPSGSYFDLPSLKCDPNDPNTCKLFSTIYANATDFITRMWDGSFSYAPVGTGGYIFPAPGAQAYSQLTNQNPNVNAAPNVSAPAFCSGRFAVDGLLQVVNDIQLYASNQMLYSNTSWAGSLYTSTFNAASNAWFKYTPPAAPTAPAAVVCSGAGAASATVALAAASVAALLLARA